MGRVHGYYIFMSSDIKIAILVEIAILVAHGVFLALQIKSEIHLRRKNLVAAKKICAIAAFVGILIVGFYFSMGVFGGVFFLPNFLLAVSKTWLYHGLIEENP